MFDSKVYVNRRNKLREQIQSGIVLILGNQDASMNYAANIYHFRQDSSFLYFFGLDQPNLAGILDIDESVDYIFGDDVDIDDIIWMGHQSSMKERSLQVGVENSEPTDNLKNLILEASKKGRKIHILPPYRGESIIQLEKLFDVHHSKVIEYVSEKLIKAVVNLRSIKDENEIVEIEKAVDIAYEMHTTAMKMSRPGIVEREVAGAIEGVSLSHGGNVSFPVILTINGQILHNHYHGNILKDGQIMVSDAGSESELHYSSDITRSIPVGGKFNQRQKEIYEIVLKSEVEAIKAIKPGVTYKSVHLMVARIIADGLKDLGLMKGDMGEAVSQGAHAMFYVHGLGHMMGLDVHDMEGLGENYVGYDDEISRSDQFGLAFLRLARKLQQGFVLTVEPGIYFIPALIDQWRNEKKFMNFINYDKVETYKDFGGIRIEDDILVTSIGHHVLGKPIPKTINEIEDLMRM